MTGEHIDDLIDLYAFGVLEPDDEARVDEHLLTCTQCRELLDDHKRVVELLAWTPDQYDPPPELKQKVVRRIEQLQRTSKVTAGHSEAASEAPQQQRRWYQSRVGRGFSLHRGMALAFVLLLLLGGWNVGLQWRLSNLSADVSEQERAIAVLRANGARMVSLAPQPAAPMASGNLLVDANGQDAYLVADGLPALPADKAYQLWLSSGDKRSSGAIFRPNAQGKASVYVWSDQPLKDIKTCGITIEPAKGSPAPTGQRVLRSAPWGNSQ